MRIVIQMVPHGSQRYDTIGDYWREGDTLHIRVSEMSDPRWELLTAVHELVEAALVEQRGIDIGSVDAFDLGYEAARAEGDFSEPGDHETAPYHREHVFATSLERQLARELEVDWDDYEAGINGL